MESLQTSNVSRAEEKKEQRRRESRIRRLILILLLLLLLLFSFLLAYLALYGDLLERVRRVPVQTLFSIYGFERPLGVSADADGNVYISDTGNARFLIYNSAGRFVKKITDKKKTDRFYGIAGSYFDDKDGKLYVADFRRRVINVYNRKGKRISRFPNNPGNRRFGRLGFSPFAISMYKDKLYVTSNDGIYAFSKKGKLQKNWTGRGSRLGQWDYPVSIAIDKKGIMFVADQLNRRVVAMDQKGNIKWVLGQADRSGKAESFFGLPRGLSLDGEGRLFISDTFHHEIVVVTRSGKLVGVIGGRGVEDGKLNFPEHISFRPDGVLYIADRENNRIQAWRVNKIRKPDKQTLKRYKKFFRQSKG